MSMAKVALAHDINTNILHGWRKLTRRVEPVVVRQEFVPVSDLGAFRQLRQLLTDSRGLGAITRPGFALEAVRELGADQYGLRTVGGGQKARLFGGETAVLAMTRHYGAPQVSIRYGDGLEGRAPRSVALCRRGRAAARLWPRACGQQRSASAGSLAVPTAAAARYSSGSATAQRLWKWRTGRQVRCWATVLRRHRQTPANLDASRGRSHRRRRSVRAVAPSGAGAAAGSARHD